MNDMGYLFFIYPFKSMLIGKSTFANSIKSSNDLSNGVESFGLIKCSFSSFD